MFWIKDIYHLTVDTLKRGYLHNIYILIYIKYVKMENSLISIRTIPACRCQYIFQASLCHMERGLLDAMVRLWILQPALSNGSINKLKTSSLQSTHSLTDDITKECNSSSKQEAYINCMLCYNSSLSKQWSTWCTTIFFFLNII